MSKSGWWVSDNHFMFSDPNPRVKAIMATLQDPENCPKLSEDWMLQYYIREHHKNWNCSRYRDAYRGTTLTCRRWTGQDKDVLQVRYNTKNVGRISVAQYSGGPTQLDPRGRPAGNAGRPKGEPQWDEGPRVGWRERFLKLIRDNDAS